MNLHNALFATGGMLIIVSWILLLTSVAGIAADTKHQKRLFNRIAGVCFTVGSLCFIVGIWVQV